VIMPCSVAIRRIQWSGMMDMSWRIPRAVMARLIHGRGEGAAADQTLLPGRRLRPGGGGITRILGGQSTGAGRAGGMTRRGGILRLTRRAPLRAGAGLRLPTLQIGPQRHRQPGLTPGVHQSA
jgi:hypothetical protein